MVDENAVEIFIMPPGQGNLIQTAMLLVYSKFCAVIKEKYTFMFVFCFASFVCLFICFIMNGSYRLITINK